MKSKLLFLALIGACVSIQLDAFNIAEVKAEEKAGRERELYSSFQKMSTEELKNALVSCSLGCSESMRQMAIQQANERAQLKAQCADAPPASVW